MINLGSEQTAKKTLMNAVARLTDTANRLDDLSNLSELLVAKFERTEGMPCDNESIGLEKRESPHPDIIDLLYGIDGRLDNLLNKIGSNVEKVISMID